MMHAIVELAKRSIEEFIRDGETVCPQEQLPDEMTVKAGVFVCIKKRGELRGCIGTFLPCCDNVAAETVRNAISAATQDPRFPPVAADELDQLSYSVDVLAPPEKVNDPGELDPRKFGVIVSHGNRRGLLLPDLEGVDTVEEQLRIAKMKACIMPGEEVEIFRFRVARYR
jgi:AmmeMemoRadiSam system protein A